MTLRFTFVAVIIVNVATIFGQKAPSFDPSMVIYDVEPIVCPAGHLHSNHYVPPRVNPKLNASKKKEITIIPSYSPGTPPEVRTAIEEKVFPIIEADFSSPVPLRISFNWSQQAAGTLASAGPNGFISNFDNHLFLNNVFFPIPLAEKIARRNLNGAEESDIDVTINSGVNWCFDCDTPADVGLERFDFTSVVIHEIYHGIGFFAFSNVIDNGTATQRLNGISSVFNYFMELRSGERTILLDDGSQELLNHFQSNQLFFNLFTAGRVKLFAPNPFDPGSSVSHLDEATYNGTPNALMTPSSQRGEVERSGGIANDMLFDMGWIYTYLLHDPVDPSIEQPVDQDFVVSVDIISDNGFVADSLQLHYSSDEFMTDDNIVAFTQVDEDTYQAAIPSPNEIRVVNYYIEVIDNRGNRFSNPGVNFNELQFAHQYAFGPDEIDPILTHTPVTSVKSVDQEISLSANSSDVFAGVDTILVEWQLNGTPQPTVGMELDTANFFEDDRYIGAIPLPGNLSASDLIEYRLIATDAAAVQNQTTLPESGFYAVAIIEVAAASERYTNDFNEPTSDFEGNGFSVTQPAGFPDMAIHSDHPYENAGDGRTINLLYELSQPIVLKERGEATMEYDEIVLVEPGDPGTSFGDDNFWDFVIVEGKKLGDSDWLKFLDGYDSGADPTWLTAYNNAIPNNGQNSGRVGDPNLFRPRVIDLLETGSFSAGDTVIIRFRLFSDPFAFGWGWAIDNLNIQDESVPVSDFILEENFELVPNPSDEEVTVVLDLESLSDRMTITIVDVNGRKIITDRILNPDRQIRRRYHTRDLTPGIYFVNVLFNNKETISQKLIINR